jgi:hypothetical protein
MAKAPVIVWRWRLRNAKKRGGWEVLRWAMTEPDAAEWARKNRVELEKVPGSREERHDLYGSGGYGGVPTDPGMRGKK